MIYNRDRVAEVTGSIVAELPTYFYMEGCRPVASGKEEYNRQFAGVEPDMCRRFLQNHTCGWFDPLLDDEENPEEPEVSDITLTRLIHNFVIPVELQLEGAVFYPVDLSGPDFVNNFSEWWYSNRGRGYWSERFVSKGIQIEALDSISDEDFSRFVPKFKLPWRDGVCSSGDHFDALVECLVDNPSIIEILQVTSPGFGLAFGRVAGDQ